jgi:cell wall assembly regulator SMI1
VTERTGSGVTVRPPWRRCRHNGPVPTGGRLRGPLVLAAACVLIALLAAGSGPARPDARRYVTIGRLVLDGDAPVQPVPRTPTPTRPTPRRPIPPVPVAACHPSGAPVAVAPVDPAVTAAVNASWARIERWLAAHAPKSYASLRPPASPAAIARAQAALGRPLPPELVASLRRHDGTVTGGGAAFTLPPFYRPVAVADIPTYWRVSCDVIEHEPGDQDWYWTPGYTPFAEDGSGDELVLDQRPGHGPHVGEFFIEDRTDLTGWPGSLTEMLQITAGALETGQPWRGFRPIVTAGALDWDIR